MIDQHPYPLTGQIIDLQHHPAGRAQCILDRRRTIEGIGIVLRQRHRPRQANHLLRQRKELLGLPFAITSDSVEISFTTRVVRNAILYEQGLAALFSRHPTSIKRAVQRGELPTDELSPSLQA